MATLYHYLLRLARAVCADEPARAARHRRRHRASLIGPAGLLWLNLRRASAARRCRRRDRWTCGFIALLFLVSLTGLALLAWRDTGAMALLLAVHLGVVMALFVTLPYGKFAHGIYRSAALLKWAIEKRQPNPLMLTEE